MAFVINFFKTVRTHWKKSIAFTGIAIYGCKFAKRKYEEDLLRRQYCAEAKLYGEENLKFGGECRKITVFLNPAASGGTAKKLFEKNAAPLLYLAGLEVNLVKTEYDGQVKEFLKVLEKTHTDGIVVAGGNGTVLETVTGIMRKDDKGFRQKIPIGVIPVGEQNKFAQFFYGPDKDNVRRSLDAAMAVVKGVSQKLDVLRIQGEDGKSTYALCGLETGAYRDARERAKKYWYFGPLKHRIAYIRKTLGEWPPVIKGQVEYVLARSEDADKPKKAVKPVEEPKQTWSWGSLLFGSRNNLRTRKMEEEFEEEVIIREEDNIVKLDRPTIEMTMSSSFDNPEQKSQKLSGVKVGLGPDQISKADFITEGWKRINNKEWTMGSDHNEQMIVKMIKLVPQPDEGTEMWYSIDGEQFEAIPVEVTLLKDRLRIFTDQSPSQQT